MLEAEDRARAARDAASITVEAAAQRGFPEPGSGKCGGSRTTQRAGVDQASRSTREQGVGALRRLTAAVLLALGCASPGMPPGGPPDVAAPQIIAIAPDSGRVGVTPKEVIFRFDET